MLDKFYENTPSHLYDDTRTDPNDDVIYNQCINQMMPEVGHDTGNIIICTGCGTRIMDRYFLLVAGQHWHLPCLRCCDCNVQLDSQITCFSRDGNIYCKEDYLRKYSVRRCARCHVGVSSHEFVMRSKDLLFHLECFSCASCHRQLSTGDTYGLHGDQIFCQDDYELLLNNFHSDDTHMTSQYISGQSEMIEFFNGILPLQKGRPRKRKHMSENCLQTLGMVTNERGDIIPRDSFHHNSHPTRQKRVRTSFKHHQLRVMKQYFGLNHNPDAKDLKQLSQKTQLSKRVLQVWFQNARAKYRRGQSKQDGDGNDVTDTKSLAASGEDGDLLDLSKCPSPAMSDISSGQSMSDSCDIADTVGSGDNLAELFSDDNTST